MVESLPLELNTVSEPTAPARCLFHLWLRRFESPALDLFLAIVIFFRALCIMAQPREKLWFDRWNWLWLALREATTYTAAK